MATTDTLTHPARLEGRITGPAAWPAQGNLQAGADSASRPSEGARCARMTVLEIAQRLDIGRLAVYEMLEQGILPGIRLGRRWIITRHAYEQWESTCGKRSGGGLQTQPEVMVLN
jgi:excisionase family DNA binding protein